MKLELVAVEWAMRKCRLYLLGLPSFQLVVDHQALVTISDKYTLDVMVNPKLQRLKERLSPFIFTTTWRKPRQHAIPDALSRAPVNDPGPDDEVKISEMQSLVRREVIHHVNAMHQVDGDVADSDAAKEPPYLLDPMLDDLRTAAASNTEYMELIATIMDGSTSPDGPRRSPVLEDTCRTFGGRRIIWPAYLHPEIGPSRTFTETPRCASGHRAEEKAMASNGVLARYFQRHHSPGGELPELSAERALNVRSSANKGI